MKIKKRFDSKKIYFTSDTHFNHEAIIKNFIFRPFKDVQHMNEELIKRWNEKISDDDIIFHLGDFSLNSRSEITKWILESLNGVKYLVSGNHERDILRKAWTKKYFKEIKDILDITVLDNNKEQKITMCHYPMLSWYQSHRGSWQMYGHQHGSLDDKSNELSCDSFSLKDKLRPVQVDVGCDTNNFYPYSYNEIKDIINKKLLSNDNI